MRRRIGVRRMRWKSFVGIPHNRHSTIEDNLCVERIQKRWNPLVMEYAMFIIVKQIKRTHQAPPVKSKAPHCAFGASLLPIGQKEAAWVVNLLFARPAFPVPIVASCRDRVMRVARSKRASSPVGVATWPWACSSPYSVRGVAMAFLPFALPARRPSWSPLPSHIAHWRVGSGPLWSVFERGPFPFCSDRGCVVIYLPRQYLFLYSYKVGMEYFGWGSPRTSALRTYHVETPIT